MNFPIREIAPRADDFPELLRTIPDCPSLFVRGALPGAALAVAIVGTRKATREGTRAAGAIAEELARRGLWIISGLAFGVDAAAHEGTLRAGGKTLAVLGHGLDSVYPRQHTRLADAILAAGGGLVSEHPEGTPTFPSNFLRRNRIIAGIALATIVVEAPARSGSLATARHAAEYGREVFVAPGPYNHPHYRGSHLLIRSGARLAASAADILLDLAFLAEAHPALGSILSGGAENTTLEPHEAAVLHVLIDSQTPLTIDTIAERSGLEPSAIYRAITTLTLTERISEAGGLYAALQKS